MDGSLYQRAWDGVRLQAARGGWQWTAAAVLPTQGTFEESANLPLDRRARRRPARSGRRLARWHHTPSARLRVVVPRHPRGAGPARTTPARWPRAADVSIGTLGAAAAGVYPWRAGAWDVVAWAAGQVGDWYGQPHRAGSAVAEGGYRWSTAPWRPWLRAGRRLRLGRRRRTPTTATARSSRCCRPAIASCGRNTYALMNVARRVDRTARCSRTRGVERGGRRPPRVARVDGRPLVRGQWRHRAPRQLLRLPRAQHPRSTHAGHAGRSATLSWQRGPMVATARLRRPGSPAATPCGAVFAGRRLFTAAFESTNHFLSRPQNSTTSTIVPASTAVTSAAISR